jgi:hypothetical protein
MQIGPKQDVKALKLRISPIVGWLIRITPPCQDMTRLLSEAMDRPLPLGIRIKMRLHFLICKWCERYKNQLLFLRQALRRKPDEFEGEVAAPSASLSPEAKDRLKRVIRNS